MQAVLLTIVYVAALAVALRDPSAHLPAGLAVLAAVLWRLPATRSAITRTIGEHPLRRRPVAVEDAVVPAVAPAAPG